MKSRLTIVWFYRDLRLGDNIALTEAAAHGEILPLYILDDTLADGGASKWWLQEALNDLAREFARRQTPLLLKRGKALEILRSVIAETGATSVTWARRYEPVLAARDAVIARELEQDGIEVSIKRGFLLFEPENIKTNSGTPFKVYTPFSKACLAVEPHEHPLPVPNNLRGAKGVSADHSEAWKLVPPKAKWLDGLKQAWRVGEAAAQEHLHTFIHERLPVYKTARDKPAVDGTSRLSPYLHFGHISPRQVWHAIATARAHDAASASSAERFRLELLWREFSWHLLHHVPDLDRQPMQKAFASMPWRKDAARLQAWQRGQTGYPIIDAAMRELWQTGWMHNRLRMITASFLIKDLLIDWREGMAWFWDTLVDADLGNNAASWQWVAGCGADAAPYFRIFNPVLQGQKFDPEGDYIRRYIPELAKLPSRFIQEPWKAPADVLAKAGVVLGETYPRPIVDHGKARVRALDALKISKNGGGQSSEGDDLFG